MTYPQSLSLPPDSQILSLSVDLYKILSLNPIKRLLHTRKMSAPQFDPKNMIYRNMGPTGLVYLSCLYRLICAVRGAMLTDSVFLCSATVDGCEYLK